MRTPKKKTVKFVKDKYWILLLALIILVAAGLRFVKLDWDEDAHLHPDERFLSMVTNDIAWLGNVSYFDTGKSPLNPTNAGKPFFVYGTFPVFLTKIIGDTMHYAGFNEYTFIGRVLSSVFDIFTVVVIFLIAKELFDRKTALLSAFLLSITVIHIQHSHYFIVDLFSSFFIALSFYFLLLLVKTNNWPYAVPLGISWGLGTAAKISAAFLAPIIFLGCIIIFVKRIANKKIDTKSSKFLSKRFCESLLSVLGLGLLVAVTAFIVFRVFQPYAFTGPNIWNVKLAGPFINGFESLKTQYTPTSYFPPAYQWVNQSPFFQLKNLTLWGLGIPLSIICWLGILLGSYHLIIKREIKFLLPIAWIIFMVAYMSLEFVKNQRYLLPITPFLILFGAYFLGQILNSGQKNFKNQEKYLRKGVVVILILGCLIWTGAFLNIYSPHMSRIQASVWIYENIPSNNTLAIEHWDDGMPFSVRGVNPVTYKMESLSVFDQDNYAKIEKLSEQLSRSDYIIISSNRAYKSIPRLPDRFSTTINYYELLFAGRLGYDLVKSFTNYPSLFGWEINDDSADESFTVYDHPKVMIFKNVKRLTKEEISTLLNVPVSNNG